MSQRPATRFGIVAALLCLLSPAVWAVDDFRDPEQTSGTLPRAASREVVGKQYMISAANPLAAEAGAQILAQGGNAIDAAIAAQLVLNVVEPQSSGIGGGGFLLYYDARKKVLHAYDGRETAPIAVDERLFLDADGKPMAFEDASRGGHAVGTPGLMKLLETAHQKHGHAEWPSLFSEAIRLSGQGFPLSARLHDLLSTTAHIKEFDASIAPYLKEDGRLKDVGDTVINKPLHDTFAMLSMKGSAPFYNGTLAREIVQAVATSPIHPGELALEDLQHYTVKTREPLCLPYRSYRVCSMPPPSSGGLALLQAVTMLELLPAPDITQAEPLSPDAAHAVTEVSRLAFADRNRYLADPDFVEMPVAQLTDRSYLASRAARISADTAMAEVPHGIFPHARELDAAFLLSTEEAPSTTHISVVDMQGNAVSMTTSIEGGFGSGLSVGGFLLNNQMTDFSFEPVLPDGVTPHPNRIEPRKRPRSSMSPTMVFDKDDRLVLVIGSPGGARIIPYVLQAMLAVLDWNLDIQQAVSLPHYLNMNGPTELEAGTAAEALRPELEKRGHQVRIAPANSGLHGILIRDGRLYGGADPRREGVAIGR